MHESFSYDTYKLYNRLTGWGEDNQENFEISYNNNGNLNYKTDITDNSSNNYQYNSSRPHAVTNICNPTQEYLDFVQDNDRSLGVQGIQMLNVIFIKFP